MPTLRPQQGNFTSNRFTILLHLLCASRCAQAIASAAWVFKMGKTFGFDMDLLDIGGGFAGCTPSADGAADLRRVSVAVNAALNAHFPPRNGVRIIAEPGR